MHKILHEVILAEVLFLPLRVLARRALLIFILNVFVALSRFQRNVVITTLPAFKLPGRRAAIGKVRDGRGQVDRLNWQFFVQWLALEADLEVDPCFVGLAWPEHISIVVVDLPLRKEFDLVDWPSLNLVVSRSALGLVGPWPSNRDLKLALKLATCGLLCGQDM